MIGFYDFNPELDGSVAAAAHRASEWVEQHNVDVVNIETVVLPKSLQIHLKAGIWTGSGAIEARQFIRVWYRAEKRIDPPSIGVSTAHASIGSPSAHASTSDTGRLFEGEPFVRMTEE